MKLASLAFVVVLLVAHLVRGLTWSLALPLSMLRDGPYGFLGYVLFGLLFVIAGLMLQRLYIAGRDLDACLLGLAAILLFLVAVTPSDNGFHILVSLAVIYLLFCYYSAVLPGHSAAWLWGHLALQIVLLLGTLCHSYGLWQKSLIIYFVLAVNVQHWMLSRGRFTLDALDPARLDGVSRLAASLDRRTLAYRMARHPMMAALMERARLLRWPGLIFDNRRPSGHLLIEIIRLCSRVPFASRKPRRSRGSSFDS